MTNTPIWVAAHLYDIYGTFLIGLTTEEKANQWSYYKHARYDSMELAQGYIRQRLSRIDQQSKNAYNRGEKHLYKTSRQSHSPFLRFVFRDALEKMEYNGWIEVA